VDGAQQAALSGRELIDAIVAGRVPQPPMLQTLSIRIVEAGDKYAVLERTPGPRHLHSGPVVHGGYALPMIDGATGAAANTLRPPGGLIGTIETKVNLVRAITLETGPVRARGHGISAGRRIVLAEALLTDLNGELLAYGTSTLMGHDPDDYIAAALGGADGRRCPRQQQTTVLPWTRAIRATTPPSR
jgi:uncharacterized protein (TIGR00369 family)